jgi:glycerophosphoryl diester phosphodiesterase
MVREAQRNGMRVTGWPGDSLEQLQTLVDWGVDNITTNNPSIALPFLRERGLLDE